MTTKTVRQFFPRIQLRKGGYDDAVRVGSGAQNSPFTGIWIWSDYPHRTATLCQELYEWRRNVWRVGGAILSLASAAIVGTVYPQFTTEAVVAGSVGMAGFLFLYASKTLRRGMEVLSHEIEAQLRHSLYGQDLVVARASEAGSLRSYPWTRSMTHGQAYFAMVRKADAAKAWIERNRSFIDKAHQWRLL